MDKKKIVVIGAGFGGAYTFKQLHRHLHGDARVELTLINPTNYFLFTPLLHEVATGGVSPDSVAEPLRQVLGCCLHSFYQGHVTAINRSEKIIQTDSGEVSYDYLVVAPGSESNFFGTPGAKEHTFGLKTLPDAVKLKNHIISTIENAAHTSSPERRKELLRYVIIGAGPTGVELAAELAELLHGTVAKEYRLTNLHNEAEVILIDSSEEPLAKMAPKFRQASHRTLSRKGVHFLLNERVQRIHNDSVELLSGTILKTKTPVWVAGVKPQHIDFAPDIKRDERGRMLTDQNLSLINDSQIFALGDAAVMKDPPTPEANYQLAQVASRQAITVANNIIAHIENTLIKPFTYKHAGDLVSLGHWAAAGKIAGIFFSGRFAWWLWRTIYLSKILSWRKKLKVAADWTVNLFSPRDTSQL